MLQVVVLVMLSMTFAQLAGDYLLAAHPVNIKPFIQPTVAITLPSRLLSLRLFPATSARARPIVRVTAASSGPPLTTVVALRSTSVSILLA